MSSLTPAEKAKAYFLRHEADRAAGNTIRLHGPCITISRETGAGANNVCDSLMQFFDTQYPPGECPWAVFDKNLIDKVVEDHKLPERIKGYLSEEKFSALNTLMNEMLGLHPPMVKLIHKTAETIMQLSQMGYCVIVGRGANLITATVPKAIHVRLIAPYESRVQHMKDFYYMSTKQAEDFIKSEDANRRKYVETHFHKNPDDPHLYHLIINTGVLSFDQAARCIGNYALEVDRRE